MSAKASFFGGGFEADVLLDPHTSCPSNKLFPPLDAVLPDGVDHGLDDGGTAGFAAEVEDRSRPPKDELRPDSPLELFAAEVGGEAAGKEPKSPKPAAEGEIGPAAAAGLAANKLMMSFLPLAPDAEAAEGLVAEVDAAGSCQSRSNIPPPPPPEALAAAGATGAALGGAFAVGAGADCGSSSNKSNDLGGATGAGDRAVGGVAEAEAGAGAAGAAAPPSRTAGSDGGGPSLAHRRDSYLLRMNDSILWSAGTWPLLRCASQYRLHRRLPHFCIESICSGVQMSKSIDLTAHTRRSKYSLRALIHALQTYPC